MGGVGEGGEGRKEILPGGEALRRGREGGRGGDGRGEGGEGRGRRKFYLGGGIDPNCIDPNEGEALRRGSTSNLGGWHPLASCSADYGGAGGGRDMAGGTWRAGEATMT